MNTFSIGETIRFSWQTFMKRPWVFVGASVILFLANVLVESFVDSLDGGALEFVGGLASVLAGTLMGLGMTAFFIKAHDAVESVDLKALWHPEGFLRYLGATLLQALASGIAFIPFMIALFLTIGAAAFGSSTNAADMIANFGALTYIALIVSLAVALYVSATLLFGAYAVVDRGVGPIVALKESFKITKGHRLNIIGYLLVIIVLNILGAVALFVGLLVTVPMTMLGFVHIYRALSRAKHHA